MDSLTVGLNQLGSFIAALLVYPITNKFGRKWTIIGASVSLREDLCGDSAGTSAYLYIFRSLTCLSNNQAFYVVGAIIQVAPTSSLGAWYFGRFVAGMGMGGLSVVVPMYSAEMTPKEIRGRCGSFYQWLYTWGILTAYWTDYGVEKNTHIAGTDKEWQIPIGLEVAISGLLLLGTFTLPESSRWLLTQNRTDEAWKSLTWIRGDDGETTHAEFTETQLGLAAERAACANFSIRELWAPENRLRFIIGPFLFMFQNTTGSSALAVFAPEYFKLIVGTTGNRDLLLTGLFGAVKVIACTFFILVLAERIGRRAALTGGSVLMAICMLIVGLITKYIPTSSASTGDVTSAGMATVAMIYLDIMIYNCRYVSRPSTCLLPSAY